MNPAELLLYINDTHNTTFQLLGRYSDGEQGAFAIVDNTNRRCVLKWRSGIHNMDRMQDAHRVTDILRTVCYPAPHYLFIGIIGSTLEGIYSIQATLPGAPTRNLTETVVTRLLELNRLQEDLAPSNLPDWHQEAVTTVLLGGNGYCLHTSLQHHSQETNDLLTTLQALTATYQHEPHRTHDIVHNDFQHSNILVHDAQISGIIDWDAPYAGDCVFDSTTLLFYAYDDPDIRALLWHHVLERTSLHLLSLYFAHLILRQVDWSLRYHDQTTSQRFIERGWTVLQELAYRSY